MNKFQTGAVRDTGGKGRMDLLPWSALIRVSKHMEDAILPDPETGVPHYPERNWEEGLPMHTMIDSAFRHLAKYMEGWDDEDHLCAAATNLLMAMWTEEHKPDMQDIPTHIENTSMNDSLNELPIITHRCKYYNVEFGIGVCYGTKEKDPCMRYDDPTHCTRANETE